MRDDGTGTDETLAAPSTRRPLAQGTTRGTEATIDAQIVAAGQVTRASSPSLSEVAAPTDHPELPVVDPANYQIIKELARGGMGRILEARDLRLGRPIAIKEVLHADEGARLRFDREVRITARLQHPAIVHVTEAGQWPTGQPFFAMKLISGKPLDKKIAEAATFTDRLALLPAVIALTDALAYAHTRSVIHRDLKPANVLVGEFGETVVIDWGIAKDLSADKDREEVVSLRPQAATSTSNAGETVEGSIMGTPSYMPPEQASGERVDARADVYALGALLYHLLAGVPPFIGRSTAEVLAMVIGGKPEPLSALVPDAPVDLIAIVDKAMARDPEDRFPTANEMVLELKRFSQGKLVASHDYTTWELTKRWLQRNRTAILVGVVAFATLVVVGVYLLTRTFDAQKTAEVEKMQARAQADSGTISDARDALATDPTRALAILKGLYPGTAEVRAARTIASDAAAMGVAHVMQGGGSIRHLAFSPDGKSLASYELPGNTIRIWDLATWTSRPIGGAPEIADLAYTGDGVLAVDYAGRIWSWPAATQVPSPPRLLRQVAVYELGRARFSPDGTRVLLETRRDTFPQDDQLVLADVRGGERVLGSFRFATWAPDGRSILGFQRRPGLIVRVDVATGEATTLFEGAYAPVFATDGKRTWIARDSLALPDQKSIREVASGARIHLGVEIAMMAALPDGRVVGTTSMRTHRILAESLRGQIKGQLVPFHPDEVSAGEHTLVITDGWPGSLLRLKGHTTPVESLVVSRSGVIASGDTNGTIRVWTLPAIRRDHGDGHTTASGAFMTATGELVVTHRGPRLDVFDLAKQTQRHIGVTEIAPGIELAPPLTVDRNTRIGDRVIRETSSGPDDEIVELVRTHDGRHVATVDSAGHLVIWDVVAGRGRMLAQGVVHVAINPAGTRVAISRADTEEPSSARRIVEELDVATGTPVRLGEMVPTAMLYGPGGRLAIATTQPTVFLFDRTRARALEVTPQQNYRALAFSTDGNKLYLGTDDWVVEEHDLVTGTNRSLRGHMGTVVALLYDDARKQLFSASADHTVRMWNLADGSSQILRGHTGLVTALELGADGTLLTASQDGTARIWDLESRSSRALVGHEDAVLFARHVPGGQRVVVVDRFRQIAEYPDNLPSDERLLRAWLDAATNVSQTAD